MKTLKSLSIVAILMIALSIQAFAGNFKANPQKKVIYINIISALNNPELSEAIHDQVDYNLLNRNQQIYTVNITLDNYIYKVSGTYEQWVWFFSPEIQNLGTQRSELRLD